MPETTVVSPAAVVPADRLTLGSCDARVDGGRVATTCCHSLGCASCMAEE